MIDFKHLTFLHAARLENLTRAGEELGLSQPAVSQHIAWLEEHYGAVLFQRDGRRLRLTEAGQYLKEQLEVLEQRSLSVRRELTDFIDGRRHFTIGATLTIGEYILPLIIGYFKQAHPRFELDLVIGNTREMAGQLAGGMIDFAAVEGFAQHPELETTLFGKDEMIFVCSPDSDAAGLKVLGPEELLALPLILREEGSGTREYFERYLMARGLDPDDLNIVMNAGSLSTIKQLAESGLGGTVISREAVRRELAAGLLKEIPFAGAAIQRELNWLTPVRGTGGFFRLFSSFVGRTLSGPSGDS